jgi:hypothetical protein
LGEEVAEVVVGDVDVAFDERGEGAFVLVEDGEGAGGAISAGIGEIARDFAADGGDFVDGRPVLGVLGDGTLGFVAEEEGVDLFAEVVVRPDAVGGLKDLEDSGFIGGECVERADAGEVEALRGIVCAKGGHGAPGVSNW